MNKIMKIYGNPGYYGKSSAENVTNYPIKIECGYIKSPFKRGVIYRYNGVNRLDTEEHFKEEIENGLDLKEVYSHIYGIDESDVEDFLYTEEEDVAEELGNLSEYNKIFDIYIIHDFSQRDVIIEDEGSIIEFSIYDQELVERPNMALDTIYLIDGKNINNFDLKTLNFIKTEFFEPAIDFTKDAMRELLHNEIDDIYFEDDIKSLLIKGLNTLSVVIIEKENKIRSKLKDYNL